LTDRLIVQEVGEAAQPEEFLHIFNSNPVFVEAPEQFTGKRSQARRFWARQGCVEYGEKLDQDKRPVWVIRKGPEGSTELRMQGQKVHETTRRLGRCREGCLRD
jgi:hypothetical protein